MKQTVVIVMALFALLCVALAAPKDGMAAVPRGFTPTFTPTTTSTPTPTMPPWSTATPSPTPGPLLPETGHSQGAGLNLALLAGVALVFLAPLLMLARNANEDRTPTAATGRDR